MKRKGGCNAVCLNRSALSDKGVKIQNHNLKISDCVGLHMHGPGTVADN